jgi:hypothetical protein
MAEIAKMAKRQGYCGPVEVMISAAGWGFLRVSKLKVVLPIIPVNIRRSLAPGNPGRLCIYKQTPILRELKQNFSLIPGAIQRINRAPSIVVWGNVYMKSKPQKVAWRIPEFAEAIGCCRSHVYDLIERGHLETRKLGYARYIITKPLDYLNKRDTTPLWPGRGKTARRCPYTITATGRLYYHPRYTAERSWSPDSHTASNSTKPIHQHDHPEIRGNAKEDMTRWLI